MADTALAGEEDDMAMRRLLAMTGCALFALAACGDAPAPERVDARDGSADEPGGVTVVRANLQGAQVEFGDADIRMDREGVDVDIQARGIEARVRTERDGSLSVVANGR